MTITKLDLEKASRKLSELELNITADNFTIGVLWFRVMSQSEGWVINRHKHSTFEFHFIASGTCRVILDDGEFHVGPGEFYLTAPGVFHEQDGSGELVEYCINCDIKLIEDKPSEAQHILKALSDTPCKAVKDSTGIMELFEKALSEAYEQDFGFYNHVKNLASMIIVSAARAIAGNSPIKYEIPMKKHKDDYRFMQILEFVQDNVFNPLTTNDISKYMYLSEKQVCRIVQRFKGTSTKELIEQVKFEKAKELLKRTDLSIKQVSETLGFSSEYYFNQFFKRLEGYPPGLFRSNTQNV